MKKFVSAILLAGCLAVLSSCARLPPAPPLPPVPRADIIHFVAPGETIWRIGKMYDVSPDAIIEANRIGDVHDLKMGQELRIPQAGALRPIVTLYPSQKWQYIIIHHSATEEGNSLAFHHAHLQKGWDKGVGYHFIIDNGSSGKKDGQVETSPRWIKQEDGAHCHAAEMNTKAIGICLVGNFNTDTVTPKQMESLTYLVETLKRYYRISDQHILRHGEVPGATTMCPGTRFPWEEFQRQVK